MAERFNAREKRVISGQVKTTFENIYRRNLFLTADFVHICTSVNCLGVFNLYDCQAAWLV